VPTRDHHPLSYVELLLLYNQWLLYVLLSHPDLILARYQVLCQTVLLTEDLDPSTSRLASWLYYPRILRSE
jgi:hypothetical protein